MTTAKPRRATNAAAKDEGRPTVVEIVCVSRDKATELALVLADHTHQYVARVIGDRTVAVDWRDRCAADLLAVVALADEHERTTRAEVEALVHRFVDTATREHPAALEPELPRQAKVRKLVPVVVFVRSFGNTDAAADELAVTGVRQALDTVARNPGGEIRELLVTTTRSTRRKLLRAIGVHTLDDARRQGYLDPAPDPDTTGGGS